MNDFEKFEELDQRFFLGIRMIWVGEIKLLIFGKMMKMLWKSEEYCRIGSLGLLLTYFGSGIGKNSNFLRHQMEFSQIENGKYEIQVP